MDVCPFTDLVGLIFRPKMLLSIQKLAVLWIFSTNDVVL